MAKTPLEIVQAILADPTNDTAVRSMVTSDATYVALNFDNPDLKKIMPWAGTGTGPDAILDAFNGVNRFWTREGFEVRTVLEDGPKVALFGSLTLRSKTLGKAATTPVAILAEVHDGRVTFMQFMEDTFGTTGTFRTGAAAYHSDPAGSAVTV